MANKETIYDLVVTIYDLVEGATKPEQGHQKIGLLEIEEWLEKNGYNKNQVYRIINKATEGASHGDINEPVKERFFFIRKSPSEIPEVVSSFTRRLASEIIEIKQEERDANPLGRVRGAVVTAFTALVSIGQGENKR